MSTSNWNTARNNKSNTMIKERNPSNHWNRMKEPTYYKARPGNQPYLSNKAHTPRSYLVTTSDGQQYRHNKHDLLKTGEPAPTITVPTQDETDEGPVTTSYRPLDSTHNMPCTISRDKPPQLQNVSDQTPAAVRWSTKTRTIPEKFNNYVLS